MATLEDVLTKLNSIEDKISANTEQLNAFNIEISKLRSEFENNTKKTTQSIDELQDKHTNLEDSQKFISKQFDYHKKIVENVTKKNKQLETENTKINNMVKSLQHQLQEEICKRDELEAYGRRTCVEIAGIPVTENENCKKIIMATAKLMKVEGFCEDSIDVVHRVSNKDSANIIAKFKNRSARDLFFENRWQLKGQIVHNLFSNLPDKENPYLKNKSGIFVNESLTPSKKSLFWKARVRAFELGWTGTEKEGKCWTKNGQILARNGKNSNFKNSS